MEVNYISKYGVLLQVRDELAILKLTSVFTSFKEGISEILFSAQENPVKSLEVGSDEDEENEGEDILKEGDSFKAPFTADEIQSGRHLIYVNTGPSEKDEITFSIYPLREKHKRSSRLKVSVNVVILYAPDNGEIPEKVCYLSFVTVENHFV